MDNRAFEKLVKPLLQIAVGVFVFISAVATWFNVTAGLICIGVSIIASVSIFVISRTRLAKGLEEIKQQVSDESEEITKGINTGAPLLMCQIDPKGRLLWSNNHFVKQFPDQESFDAAAGETFTDLFFDNEKTIEEIVVGEKTYSVSSVSINRFDGPSRLLFWQNVSARETIKELYINTRACLAVIDIDNYEDLITSVDIEDQSSLAASIDKLVHSWALEMNAAIIKVKASRYVMVFENRYMALLRNNKFSIIDDMHQIHTDADFPASLSMGVAVGESELSELLESATEALELAQGRGGDQAVVRLKGGETEYFGGALPSVAKHNKSRSRIIAHMLTQMVEGSQNVLIMGHKNPDLDAFGAAAGVYLFAKKSKVPAYIVLDEPSDAIRTAFDTIKDDTGYAFITSEHAEKICNEKSLVIVVDTHIPQTCECPKLLESGAKIALIDHHRKSSNAIENASLTHMETYASSASELITEMLQYAKIEVPKKAAELLLAGIELDTKNFTQNTGVRTYEAAGWLRRCNPDIQTIRSFFKMDLLQYQKKSNMIASAEILSNGIAVAYTKESDSAMQMLCAQAADELLGMKGVEAAFVAGKTESKTVISARSLGKINVQVIMEALGGGGHQNVAAAQVDEIPEEAIAKIVNYMRENEIL